MSSASFSSLYHDIYNELTYRLGQAAYTRQKWKNGDYDALRSLSITKYCINPNCKLSFNVKPGDAKKFCSKSCSAQVNNSDRIHKNTKRYSLSLIPCINCGNPRKNYCFKFCSLKCQANASYQQYIDKGKQGLISGVVGLTTITLSAYIRRYLWKKYKNKCSKCGWSKIHPLSNKAPLEINHIDGNSENNSEDNLELICPNCHALTINFRNLNKCNGREWRLKYLKRRQLLPG